MSNDFTFKYETGFDIASNFDFNQYPQTRIAYLELIDGTYRTVKVIDHNRFLSDTTDDEKEIKRTMEISWEINLQWRDKNI